MPAGGKVPSLGGPIFLFFVGVLSLGGMLAAYVVLDSLIRRQRGRYTAREPWWIYTVSEGLYLLILFTVQFPFVPNWGGAVSFLLTPIAIALGVAYLLRVVFPKPPAQEPADEPVLEPAQLDAETLDDPSIDEGS